MFSGVVCCFSKSNMCLFFPTIQYVTCFFRFVYTHESRVRGLYTNMCQHLCKFDLESEEFKFMCESQDARMRPVKMASESLSFTPSLVPFAFQTTDLYKNSIFRTGGSIRSWSKH